MDPADAVGSFVESHELRAAPEFRILDLVSEVGELAKNVTTSSAYGADPGAIRIEDEELGDVLFAAYALAHETGIDPTRALERSIDKYRNRIAESEDPGSGRQ